MLDMRRELEEIKLACMATKLTRAYRVDGLEDFSAKPLAAEPFMGAQSSLPNKIDMEDYLRDKMANMISPMAAEAKVPCAAAVPFEKMSTEDYLQERLDKLLAPQAATSDFLEEILREKERQFLAPEAGELKSR